MAEVGQVQFPWLEMSSAAFEPFYENPSKIAHEQPPANARSPGPDSDYVGTWSTEYFGPMTISKRDGELCAAVGPKHFGAPLVPWTGNRFSFTPTGENAVGPTLVSFNPGSGGEPDSVTIESFSKYGIGTFLRE